MFYLKNVHDFLSYKNRAKLVLSQKKYQGSCEVHAQHDLINLMRWREPYTNHSKKLQEPRYC